MLLDDAPPGSSPSRERQRLGQLREIYERIAVAQAESLAAIARRGQSLACPEGCGSCCEGFIPDVLPVESDYLADWLLRERADLASACLGQDGPREPPCPFHEGGREGGCCAVYPARPLICRLFGFASVRDREGAESFSLCRRMESRGGKRSWSGSELERELGSALPVMADFAAAAAAISPAEAGERALLTEVLPASLRRALLLRRLASLSSGDDPGGDEPEPSTPAPAPRAA